MAKRIFISYSYNDQEKVNGIVNFIRASQYKVMSDWDISPGQKWEDVISEQIRNADYYIIFISKNYFSSDAASKELSKILGYAQTLNKFILPVLLAETTLPLDLSGIQYLNVTKEEDVEKIAKIIIDSIQRFEGQKIAEKEKSDEIKEQIKISIAEYIMPTKKDLQNREKHMRRWSNIWNLIGYFSLISGVALAILVIMYDNSNMDNVDWQKVAYTAIKGTIILVLLLSSSKYSFTLAKSYMNESLKNADRIHAISFGEFYIKVFESSLNSNDFKDIFQHWNISKESSFSTISADNYDPKFLESINKVITTIKDVAKK